MKLIIWSFFVASVLLISSSSRAFEALDVLRQADQCSNEINQLYSAKLLPLRTSLDVPDLEVTFDFRGWPTLLPGTPYEREALPPLQEGIVLKFEGKHIDPMGGAKVVSYTGNSKDGRKIWVKIICWARNPGVTMGAAFYTSFPSDLKAHVNFAGGMLNQDGGQCNWGIWATF
jgi:hypothetical protein